MKKLVKVRLINWHYLSNETIEIQGNTLLTGPNASGKSTVMMRLPTFLPPEIRPLTLRLTKKESATCGAM